MKTAPASHHRDGKGYGLPLLAQASISLCLNINTHLNASQSLRDQFANLGKATTGPALSYIHFSVQREMAATTRGPHSIGGKHLPLFIHFILRKLNKVGIAKSHESGCHLMS